MKLLLIWKYASNDIFLHDCFVVFISPMDHIKIPKYFLRVCIFNDTYIYLTWYVTLIHYVGIWFSLGVRKATENFLVHCITNRTVFYEMSKFVEHGNWFSIEITANEDKSFIVSRRFSPLIEISHQLWHISDIKTVFFR